MWWISRWRRIIPGKIKTVLSVDEKGMSVEGRQIQIAYWLKSNYGERPLQR